MKKVLTSLLLWEDECDSLEEFNIEERRHDALLVCGICSKCGGELVQSIIGDGGVRDPDQDGYREMYQKQGTGIYGYHCNNCDMAFYWRELLLHKDRNVFIGVVAKNISGSPDMVCVGAFLGKPDASEKMRWFVVPREEWKSRGFTFFEIDPDKHEEVLAPRVREV